MLITKRLKIILGSSVLLLLVPLIAMQFSNEIHWTLFDFVIAGVLFLSMGLLAELIIRTSNNIKTRVVLVAVLLMIFLTIWIELAVGIFGSPFAGS